MQDLINTLVENGIGVLCVVYLIYFQNTTMKDIIKTLDEMNKNLILVNQKLGIKVKKDDN